MPRSVDDELFTIGQAATATGLSPKAIRLYGSAGYKHVECYGKHLGNQMSVCFEKQLV